MINGVGAIGYEFHSKTACSPAVIAMDPAVHGGSIDKPLLHSYFPEFKQRVTTLSTLGHISTVDPSGFAESIWTKITDA